MAHKVVSSSPDGFTVTLNDSGSMELKCHKRSFDIDLVDFCLNGFNDARQVLAKVIYEVRIAGMQKWAKALAA